MSRYVWGCAWVCAGMCGCVRVCKGVRSCAWGCMDVHRYVWDEFSELPTGDLSPNISGL